MISNWTNNLKDPDEKARFNKYLLSSRGVLDRQLEIMDGMEKSLNYSELDPNAYECPSWAAKQAHKNGYRQCLQEIRKLITLDPKEHNE